MQPAIYSVRVQIAPILCWQCCKRIKAVRGYIYNDSTLRQGEVFVALRKVNDTRQLIALIADLRQRDPIITPVGLNYSGTVDGQYFSARCPYCSLICGDFFMTNASFFPEKSLCDFPDCDCCYSPDIHCKGCEYHEARLRLSAEEFQEISEWTGITR
jgi:hypothetical protein